MKKRNLYAQLYVFGPRAEPEALAQIERVVQCKFEDEYAKTDAYGQVTWFSSVFGFEIMVYANSVREDGTWYVVNIGPETDISESGAPMEEMNFHLAQVLRAAGFEQIVTLEEYRANHDQTHPPLPG